MGYCPIFLVSSQFHRRNNYFCWCRGHFCTAPFAFSLSANLSPCKKSLSGQTGKIKLCQIWNVRDIGQELKSLRLFIPDHYWATFLMKILSLQTLPVFKTRIFTSSLPYDLISIKILNLFEKWQCFILSSPQLPFQTYLMNIQTKLQDCRLMWQNESILLKDSVITLYSWILWTLFESKHLRSTENIYIEFQIGQINLQKTILYYF